MERFTEANEVNEGGTGRGIFRQDDMMETGWGTPFVPFAIFLLKCLVSRPFPLFPLPPQPQSNFIVIHHIVGGQRVAVVDKYHAPLEMDTDFIGAAGKFSQTDAAMRMRVAKGSG